jgi:peptidoglycan/xylan/chitin deacetylase (PgdA/CDA1 family)
MILLYHRVTHLAQDPHLLAVTPEHFEQQLLALQKQRRVVSLAELREKSKRGQNSEPVVALTFDDGFADNATTALPLLKKHGVPATFYLASGYIGTTQEFLQDELERLVLLSAQCPNELRFTVGGKDWAWTTRSENKADANAGSAGWSVISKTDPTPRHRAHREIHRLLVGLASSERETLLNQLRCQCGDPGPARITHRAMTWDQARNMAGCELVELGAHTVTHPCLRGLSIADQRQELSHSKRCIEEQTGRPITSFAYPYGDRAAYSQETIKLAKEIGFTNACSNFRERIGGRTDPFQLPRMVVRDWDGEEFLQRLKAGQR